MTSLATTSPVSAPTPAGHEWWRSAVIYQVYPRSFADSNGDGVGDLPGITARLDHLAALGVDAVWLSPFYVSPHADAGYDVADYRDVDPLFGELADADALVARAHELGIRVIVDLVPNHTSDEHPWFQAALAAGRGSRERARYLFRDGRGEHGELPPNDWRSVFGGEAWMRVTEPDGSPGQWYLHLFDTKQPDLDWDHEDVWAEMEDVLRFWLDRGVDGFRVDVASGLVKAPGLPDWNHEQELLEGANSDGERPPMWDQDGVHEIYRSWRRVLDAYDGDRMLVAEAWVHPVDRIARYVRPDEMHQAFNFDYLVTPWRAADQREVIDASLARMGEVGAPSTWVLSNHDVVRHTSRLGLPVGTPRPNGIGADDPQPDEELGLRRARAATTLMLALPGSAYLYQGEELGLPDHTALPDHVRQDPTFHRTDGEELGRDGCRVPVPWTAHAPAFGFGGEPWLPQPEVFARYALDVQQGVPGSTYELYRAALRLRRDHALGAGTLEWAELDGGDVLAFRNGSVLVVTNFGDEPVSLPAGAEVLLVSGQLVAGADGRAAVPTDVTVWLRA
ncbi:MAG: glycoside hydrolase family 13 protein [Actinomycetes bacterium]